MKKCICDSNYRYGCPIHDVSECCESGKYLDCKGFSHCKKCHKLFTGKKFPDKNSDKELLERINKLKWKKTEIEDSGNESDEWFKRGYNGGINDVLDILKEND